MCVISVDTIIAGTALVVSVAAALIAKSSLVQAKQVADRDQQDWKQRKWFDLYFKAEEAYDTLERFRASYPSTSALGWGTPECNRKRDDLMLTMRTVHCIALAFIPRSGEIPPEIQALFDATTGFHNIEADGISESQKTKMFDAVEKLVPRVRLHSSILD
jgi:hypothetical protein